MNQNDPRIRLITMALDGETTPTDRKRLRRLLRSDPELLSYYQKLRNDKRLLASLAVPILPIDFSRSVADALKGQDTKEIGRQNQATLVNLTGCVSRIPWPTVLAISVSWLIGFVIFSKWLSWAGTQTEESLSDMAVNGSDQGRAIRENQNFNVSRQVVTGSPKDSVDEIPEEKWADWLLPYSATTEGDLIGKSYHEAKFNDNEAILSGQGSVSQHPVHEILGAPALPSRELEELSLKLPRIVPWNDLGVLSGAFNSMKDKSGTIQLDLPAVEPGHAVDVLIGVLKAQKKGVVVDGLALDRLRRGNIRANYIVVLEDIDLKQLEFILGELKNSDGKRAPSKSAQLAPSLIVSVPESVRKQLKSMTGWDFGTDVPVKNLRPGASKDLEEETTQQAIKAIESGANSRTVGNSRPILPTALVVAYSPYYPAVKTQPQSVEVRRFVEIRQAATKPGLARAILVFRN